MPSSVKRAEILLSNDPIRRCRHDNRHLFVKFSRGQEVEMLTALISLVGPVGLALVALVIIAFIFGLYDSATSERWRRHH